MNHGAHLHDPTPAVSVRPVLELAGRALLLAGALLAGVPAHAGNLTYTDGTFTVGWTHAKVLDTTPGAQAVFTTLVQPGGFPVGNYQETTHTWADGIIVVAHFSSANWNPLNGAVCSIDFAFDARHFTGSTVGGAVRVRLAVQQNGSTYHQAAGIDVTDDLWASFVDVDATPSTFVKVDGNGPSIPDFSCSGTPITFGYTTSNSANGGPWTKVVGLDNVILTVHHGRSIFHDGTFTGNPWTSTKVLDTSPGQVNTFSVATPPTGGSPGDYREVTHSFSQSDIGVAHLESNWIHDPGVEPVYTIDYRYYASHLTESFGGGVAYSLLLEQGAGLYAGPVDAVALAAWTYFARSLLTANDFTLVAGTGPPHPNFSATGAPLTLGYYTSNAALGMNPEVKVSGIDELLITVRTSPECVTFPALVYCDGPSVGNLCPCGAGAVHHGCPNSLFPAGGRLVAIGTPSIANDTIVLQATAMPNSSCIYFQGTATQAVPAFDGVACVTGTIVRLGTKTNLCNSSQYPEPQNLKVSVRGQITSPGTYAYQVWYRNAASFCTPATANYTNGLLLNWLP